MNKYTKLRSIKGNEAIELKKGPSRLLLCPDMGGRAFAEVAGIVPHRIDLQAAARPGDDFNNYGGNNLWPAPEGGVYGFNYKGNGWYVQPAVNTQPFEVAASKENNILESMPGRPEIDGRQPATDDSVRRVRLQKRSTLVNRAGTTMETLISREVSLSDCPAMLKSYEIEGCLSYTTIDSFEITNEVRTYAGLLAAWTLEQFDATGDTISFCIADNPYQAINFDYYEHPEERIIYYEKGFTYRTDGRSRGQIGIKAVAQAKQIGFYDFHRRLLCLRRNRSDGKGLYFNIADNNQPAGQFSAADNYSIFNSDSDIAAFELETIGAAKVDGNLLQGSELISDTVLAVFKRAEDIERFIQEKLGSAL